MKKKYLPWLDKQNKVHAQEICATKDYINSTVNNMS